MRYGIMRPYFAGLALVAGIATTSSAAFADDARINGMVIDGKTGKPVAMAAVVGRDGAGTEVHVTSDKNGRYGAIGLAPGSITLAVSLRGYDSEQVTCRIPSGDSAKYTFIVYRGNGSRKLSPATSTCKLDPYTSDKTVIQ